jgi:hypothetical protein
MGTGQVSVYVEPETCETIIHHHHTHDAVNNEVACGAGQCHECSNHTHDCGCDSPEAFFFKLKNLFVDEEVLIVKAQPVEISVAWIDLDFSIIEPAVADETDNFDIDSPPLIYSPKDFLIQIQQLKIPLTA